MRKISLQTKLLSYGEDKQIQKKLQFKQHNISSQNKSFFFFFACKWIESKLKKKKERNLKTAPKKKST